MAHSCHAKGCTKPCEPRYLMCYEHWSQVPTQIKKRVWNAYIRGQEHTKRPTTAWMMAARDAIRSTSEAPEKEE